MPRILRAKLRTRGHRCDRCGHVYGSSMKLCHHQLAEHAAGTVQDIPTIRDISLHGKQELVSYHKLRGVSMSFMTRVRGRTDLRTVRPARISSKPRQKGAQHIDMYLLSIEKTRLETEIDGIERRQKRAAERVGEIRDAMSKLKQEAEQEEALKYPSPTPAAEKEQAAASKNCSSKRWKKMSLGY